MCFCEILCADSSTHPGTSIYLPLYQIVQPIFRTPRSQVARNDTVWFDWCHAPVNTTWFLYTNVFFDFQPHHYSVSHADLVICRSSFLPPDSPGILETVFPRFHVFSNLSWRLVTTPEAPNWLDSLTALLAQCKYYTGREIIPTFGSHIAMM